MLNSHRSWCASFSRTGVGFCIYSLLVWSNLTFLHISQWITLPTQSSLALYSFSANFLHSLFMWLIVSSLSSHSLHLLFCCVLSILGCPRGVMVKALDCGIVVREFVLQSRYYVHFRANTFRKGMNPLILPAIG